VSDKTQAYYEFLARTDHPVFRRDFSQSTSVTSPLNSIYNRIFADQLAKLKAVIDELSLNLYPSTVTALTIDDWENQFFGFTKPSSPLSLRVAELVLKVNKRFKMNIGDVLDLSQAIVGMKPIVTRNVARRGWVLGTGVLGISTTLDEKSNGFSAGLYLVYFPRPVDSRLLKKLDEQLTIIEKAGSRHVIKAPIPRWILGRSALGIDTTL
jgi:hypothetical protein